jgi:hypothetical protein
MRTRNLLIRGALTGVVAAAVGAGIPLTAAAASAGPSPSPAARPATLAALKARCNDAVQRRLGALSVDLTVVKAASALTSSDRTALESQLTTDQSGLTTLDATIQSDTTYAQAHADCELIVTDYRVYVLEEPKLHEVIAADGITKVNHAFTVLIPELQALINDSSQPPSVKAQAQADLNDLQSKVGASQTSISGVSASVINLQPSGYPGNAVDLKSARQNIETSRDDLAGSRADVKQILVLLG